MPRYNLDSTDTSGTGATALKLSQWISIDQGSASNPTERTILSQYGDGYKQIAEDGVNARISKWDLVFVPLQDGVPAGTHYKTDMFNFIDSVGTNIWFYWTPLGETTPKKWLRVKDTFKPTPLNASAWQVAFSVEQYFGN